MPDALTLVRAQLARIIAGNHWDRLRGAQRDLTALIGFIDELGAAPGRAPAPEPDWQHVVREMVRCFDSDASGRTSGALTSWMNSAKATLSGGAPPAARPAEPPPEDTLLLNWLDTLPCGIKILGDRDHPQDMCMTPKDPAWSHTRDLIRRAMKERRDNALRAAPPPSEAPRE